MYQISRLKNGLTVATAEMPHMASVSLGLWVGVGGRYEPAPLNGVSHFIEHLLFKGTRKRSAKQISQAVEGIGGYLNAFTGEESTCFYSKGLHNRLDELLEVLLDMFLHSIFAPGEINKERDVVKAITRIGKQFSPGQRPQFLPVQEPQTQTRVRLFTKDTAQTQLALGLRACSRHDERRYALRLLNTLLGENMSSRLFQVLRED